MRTRFKKLLAGISALAALALGGAAISQATSNPPQKSPAPVTGQEQNAPENSATDQDNVQDEGSRDETSEKGEKPDGTEKADGNEKADNEKAGSETADDDGPGGHADEPTNPNADHQRAGQE